MIANKLQDFRVGAGNNFFEALPFFFNVKSLDNLSFDWRVNNERSDASAEDPWRLNLSIGPETPSGFEINLRLTVQNLFEPLEITNKNIQVRVK